MSRSTLHLRCDEPTGDPDRPVLTILVDGVDVFDRIAPGWHAFDPGRLLTDPSPLRPTFPPRRVALCRCTCRIAGCGVIAPIIAGDRERVRWSDLRDVVGVFDGPTVECNPSGGTPWRIGPFVFDRAAYTAEIDRAVADRAWETPR